MDDDLSEEDMALKQQLELYVQMVQDADPELQKAGLKGLRQEIRTTSNSMTSIPNPFKFLGPHYGTLQVQYEKIRDSNLKNLLADILSVLAMAMSPKRGTESLKYRLLVSDRDIDLPSYEYVSNLARELVQECTIWQLFSSGNEQTDGIFQLVEPICEFLMKHNAETEAIDFLVEVGQDPNMLIEFVDSANYKKTCLYITSLSLYLPKVGQRLWINIAHAIYVKYNDNPSALLIALYLDNLEFVGKIFASCSNPLQRRQLSAIVARHRSVSACFDLSQYMAIEDEERTALQGIINNTELNKAYLALACDLEVNQPKCPLDIYVEYIVDRRTVKLPSLFLAATFVNAFLNAGFGDDTLMMVPFPEFMCDLSESWVFRHEKHEKVSAMASAGMILLWHESGFDLLEKFVHSSDSHVVAGALLGVGIVKCNVCHWRDPTIDLLKGYIKKEDSSIKLCAIMGLGLAYAGSKNQIVSSLLMPILGDEMSTPDVIAFTAISLGLVYVGSGYGHVAEGLIFQLMNLSGAESLSDHPLGCFFPLGLGLIYLGQQDFGHKVAVELKDFEDHYYGILLSCAYAGSGDVLKVQHFLELCAGHDEKCRKCQAHAVLGIAMAAMAEEVGLEMAIRSLEHLLCYGDLNIRSAVPLALGLLCISNTKKAHVIRILELLCYDSETEVAMGAIISLGLVGAGTNNASIAEILETVSGYYSNEFRPLFCVRVAQGLIHMGKGLLTLSPYHSEHFLLSRTSLAGIVIFLYACLNMDDTILGDYHYILYFLALAMQPKMLMTVDENLNPIAVPVRVGRAVDAGQAGRPQTITASTTHYTPVLLSAGERAELATDEYVPLSPILEGFVILKQNNADE